MKAKKAKTITISVKRHFEDCRGTTTYGLDQVLTYCGKYVPYSDFGSADQITREPGLCNCEACLAIYAYLERTPVAHRKRS